MPKSKLHLKSQKYQIDQSGKIEQTQVKTVIAITNGYAQAVVLSASDKKLLEQMFRQSKRPRLFPFLVFSALVAILIKKSQPKKKVLIDQEYTGQENLILERSHHYLTLLRVKPTPHLEFGHVGKLSKSHMFAHDIATGKKKGYYQATLKEVMKLIFNTKKDREPRGAKI